MAQRIAVVTGGTDGIGRETAIGIAKAGFTVYIVGRNAARGQTAASDIAAKSGNNAVHYLQADLSLQSDIKRLSELLHKTVDHIDLLVNNAGAMFKERTLTTEGFETTFALNHLNYYSFTHLVLDLVKAAGKGARIVNTASMVQAWGKMDFDDLFFEKGFAPMKAYSRSKLANVLFTIALARRLESTGITVNCLHPGFVATGFNVDPQKANAAFKLIAKLFAISPEDGAKTSIYLALSPEVEGKTGGYYANSKLAKAQKTAYDPDVQERLWEVSKKLTGIG